jgi:hypothetical protein
MEIRVLRRWLLLAGLTAALVALLDNAAGAYVLSGLVCLACAAGLAGLSYLQGPGRRR